MADLAGDQPRPPTRAAPGRADPLLLGQRQQPRHPARPRRTILETDKRAALLKRRLRPAPPPLTGRRRRDAAASRRITTRTARSRRQRPAPAGQQVRDARYGEAPSGSSFDCEPSQTHSLEGGPDDLLSRPQPIEARHLEAEVEAVLVQTADRGIPLPEDPHAPEAFASPGHQPEEALVGDRASGDMTVAHARVDEGCIRADQLGLPLAE